MNKKVNKKVLSVVELTDIISDTFNDNFIDSFIVKGEVFSISNKGHVWFTLKDQNENIIINAVIWKSIIEKEKIELFIGDIIIAYGKIKLYNIQNRYNFCIYKIKKKETLENKIKIKIKEYKEKGYFDKKNVIAKENIKKIGIITSMEGEAINDFKKTLENRLFFGKIIQKDVNVQGENCVKSIVKAINELEKNVDVILITRGGGSFLDLYEFNNDILIERIYECKTPIYCAIGHERDYTICDYVCDLRSSTPTSLALEISYDKNILINKYNLHYEYETKKYNKLEELIKNNLNNIKNEIYEYILKNKPNGFYFNNKYINKLDDFLLLCNENFKIKLLDCEINFKIEKYNIVEKYNKKYTYDKYIKLYEENKLKNINIKKYYLNEYYKKFKNNKEFGTKKNYIICKKLLIIIKNYLDEINNIKKNIEINDNYDNENYNNDNIDEIITKLYNYKKYLNYLKIYKIKKIKNLKNIREIFYKFINYNINKGINENFLDMYNKLNNYKIIYY